MTATYVIGAWFAIATVLTLIWARIGFLRPKISPVHPVSKFRQHVGHDLAELGGLSQRHEDRF